MRRIHPGKYGRVSQTFHWVMAVLVVVTFMYGLGGSEARVYDPSRDFERQLHESLGLSVFVLTLLRLMWRIAINRPAEIAMPSWMRWASRFTQGALYVLLLTVPLTAVVGAWLQGHPLTLLGGIEVDSLVAQSHDLGTTLANLHTWLGDAIVWLAGLHAAAAVFHHLVLRDGVLLSMLPGWVPLRKR